MTDKLVTFNAPEDTFQKAKAKLEYGELSEELRSALEQIAHGTDVSEQERTKDLLKEKRKQKRKKQRKITNRQNEVEELNREIERLEDKLDTLAEQDGQYDGFLQSLDEHLHNGNHVFTGHKQIEKAAELGDCSQEDVLADLRDRNPSISDEQFKEAQQYR